MEQEQTHDNVVTISDYEHKNDRSDHLRHMLQFCISLFRVAIKLSRNELIMHQPTIARFLIKMRSHFVVIFRKLLPKEFLNRPCRKPTMFRARIFYCVLHGARLRPNHSSYFIFLRQICGWLMSRISIKLIRVSISQCRGQTQKWFSNLDPSPRLLAMGPPINSRY